MKRMWTEFICFLFKKLRVIFSYTLDFSQFLDFARFNFFISRLIPGQNYSLATHMQQEMCAVCNLSYTNILRYSFKMYLGALPFVVVSARNM
jgi:hypothetical protein